MSGKIEIKTPLRRWTPEDVIKELQDWQRSGRPLSHVCRSNQSLYSAAKTHFGSWRRALTAAGLPLAHRRWEPHAVIEEIQCRIERGQSLNSGHPANRNLAAVAYRHVGSWRTAVERARRQLHDSQRRAG
jgi:hypothetical protein